MDEGYKNAAVVIAMLTLVLVSLVTLIVIALVWSVWAACVIVGGSYMNLIILWLLKWEYADYKKWLKEEG